MDYKKISNEYADELISLRRDFHSYPEIGYEEWETSKKIKNYLEGLGLKAEVITKTGVVATIYGGSPGPTVLLRSDIDALPLTEETGLPFSSRNPEVMHACGHDGHMAVLLVTAKILCSMKDRLKGNVKLVFQPNEEEAGALEMIEEGVLENPKVDIAFAQHIWSGLPMGKIGVAPGAVMAAIEHFEIIVRGKGGHTSAPQNAIDAIPAACQIVTMVQHVQTRTLNPLDTAVILFGEIQGGTASNIITGEVLLTGTMRFLLKEEETQKPLMLRNFEAILDGVSKAYGVQCDLRYTCSNPSMANDGQIADCVRKAAAETVGENNIVPYYCMGAEDFAEFSHRVPSCFFFMGTSNPEKGSDYPHHHPKFTIDEDSLIQGVEMFLRIVSSQLAE